MFRLVLEKAEDMSIYGKNHYNIVKLLASNEQK